MTPTTSIPATPTVLFTGFEPSGDDHAAAVVAELRRRRPEVKVYAWGGHKMEAAGATIVERTGENAVLGVPGLGKILEHKGIEKRIRRWLAEHPVSLHVPVDSPAANFPICAIARASGARVMHLVAPQVWAWASWRVGKLRRLSDHVCCLLPFEEEWFRARDVQATFVGHPLFDHELDPDQLDARLRELDLPQARTRLALLPGSRPKEMQRNFPLFCRVFREIRADRPDVAGVVAATTPDAERALRAIAEKAGGWPEGLRIVSGETDAVVRWSTACLVVSGTVTLQIARQARPMVIVYKASLAMWLLIGRWIVATRTFSLPNLVAGERIVPELVPFFGGHRPILHEVVGLLEHPEHATRQAAGLARVREKFRGRIAAEGAVDRIEAILDRVHAGGSTIRP